ncbi:MAG: hypothetical protein AABX39_04315 [Nanoarchaeota archaeon]
MEAVTNSTVIIFLAKIRKLELLDIFNNLFTTDTIKEEILQGKEIPDAERNILEKLFKEKIKLENPKEELDLDMEAGEKSAISLCTGKEVDFFLSDDKKARTAAEFLSIKILGTLGIILLNLKHKKINKNEAKKIVQLLVQNSYYITTDVYSRVVEMIDDS